MRFVLIWNKATDNIAINFYYLVLINMCSPPQTLFRRVTIFFRYSQSNVTLITSYSKGYTWTGVNEQKIIHCSKIYTCLGLIISNMLYVKYTHRKSDTQINVYKLHRDLEKAKDTYILFFKLITGHVNFLHVTLRSQGL